MVNYFLHTQYRAVLNTPRDGHRREYQFLRVDGECERLPRESVDGYLGLERVVHDFEREDETGIGNEYREFYFGLFKYRVIERARLVVAVGFGL